MPRVEIPGVGIVRFPDNMSREDIMSQATAMQQKASQPIFDPKDLPTSELIKGGFSRGIEGLKGTAFDLIPALAGSIIGKDDYAKEQLKEYRDRMSAAEAESPTAYKSYKDIGSIGQAFDFAAETVGELGPDIASFMLGAGVGTTAGKAIAKKALEKEIREQAAETAARKGLDDVAEKALADRLMSRAKQGAVGAKATEAGANVGLKTGLWGSSMGLNVPDVLNSVYEDTGELSPGIALTIGSLVAALDTYLPQKILSQLSPSAKERIAAEMLQKSSLVPTTWKKAFGAEVLKTSTGEALTEGAQEAITKLGSQIAGDKDPFFSQENIDQILTASLKGFIGGGTFGTPGAAFEAKRIKDERDRQIAERAALQAPPTTPGAVTGAQQVETDPNKVPKQAAPGIMYDPKTGTYVQQSEVVEPVGREMAQQVPPEMGTPELVGMGAPAVDFTQGEMFGTPAFERRTPTVEESLAGPPTAPAEFATVLTPEVLKDTGLKPQSGFYKKLLNKDMANPEDQATVRDTLAEVRQNKNLTDSTKEATERIAMQAFGALAKQQEMFGPRRGILKGADYGRVQPRPVGGAGGAGVSVPSKREGKGAPAGVTTPGEPGLAPTTEAADVAPSREKLQPSALTVEEQDAIQAELEAEMAAEMAAQAEPTAQAEVPVGEPVAQPAPVPEAPAVGVSKGIPERVAPAVAAPIAEGTPAKTVASKAAAKAPKAIRTKEGNLEFKELGRPSETNFTQFLGKGYLGFATEDIQDIDDTLKITDVVQGKFGVNPMLNAAKIYFSKMPRTVDNLINIAFDLAFNTPAFRQSPDDPLAADEVEFFRGMGGKNARFAHTWVLQNLSPEAQQKMREFIRGFEIARDSYNDAQLMDLIRSGISGFKEEVDDKTLNGYFDALEEERTAARTRAQRRAISPNKEERRKTIAEQEAFEKELAELKAKVPVPQQKSIANQVNNLSKDEISTLEKHYGVDRTDEQFLQKVRDDVVDYVNKGAQSVVEAIRNIIKKIANGLLSVAVVFNTGALQPDLFNVPQAFAATRDVSIVAPANVPMSDIAKTTYSLSAPVAIKNKQALFIADKPNGMIHMFDDKGQFIASSNALYGKQAGDILTEESRNKPIDKMTTVDKVTPAGTYKLSFSKDLSGDYAGGYTLRFEDQKGDLGGVAIHSVYLGDVKEDRLKKLSSTNLADKKVSFGCVNTSPEFILNEVLPRAGTIFEGGKKAMAVVIPDQQAMLGAYLTPLTEQLPGQGAAGKTAADLAAKEEQIAGTEGLSEIKSGKAKKFLEMPESMSEYAGLSSKTINSIFSHYADRNQPSRAGAYIGYISPYDFLEATTSSQQQIDQIREEARKRIPTLDPSKIIDFTSSPMNLIISKREGTDYYEIMGHEGRHRAARLIDAGITRIPVVFKLRNYEPPGAKPLTRPYFIAQNGNANRGFIALKLLPVSYDYKQDVETAFGAKPGINLLFQNPIAQLAMPIHPAIAARIMTGDLVGALRMLSANPNNFIARAASRLANVNLQTKLVVQENLYNDAGKPVPGYYDPNNDTIYIDPNSGMNVHTLLHEAGHAATSHVMDNPSHPLTKQVTNLLNEIRDSLGSAYGATNADEFLAEAQSNPEFKALLQSIYPDGKPISAWDKLVRMVSNFMRRLFGMEARPLESAFDQVDRFVNAIISPAPESRDAGILYSAANTGMAGKVFDRLGTSLEALPGMTPARADNVHEFLKNTVGGNFRNFMLSVLPQNALDDVAASKGLKDALSVGRTINERSGYEYKLNEKIEPVVKQAEDFAKKESQAQIDLFNKVVYDSTLNKVDPTKPDNWYTKFSLSFNVLDSKGNIVKKDYRFFDTKQERDEAIKKFNEKLSPTTSKAREFNNVDPQQVKVYYEVKEAYNKKLGGAGKALYITMRDAYKEMYQRILDTIEERIDASVTDPTRANIIKNDIYERLITKGRIDPYFPLARYGKYWLSYSARDDSGQIESYVEAFETERERARYMQQLEQSGAQDIEAFSNLSELNYRRAPPGSFVNGVLKVMELNNVPPAVMEEVLRLFLSSLPETAFAQSFQRRKETLGFNKDAIRALRERVYRTSHQLASMRYASKLNQILSNMKEYVEGVGRGDDPEGQRDNRVINEYVKEYEKRIEYINNPTVSKWSQVATSFGFNMTLGFNVSSAVINLTQVPLILYPYLAGTYGYGETSRAISDAYKIYLNSGFNREVELIGSNGQRVRQKAMPALDNYDFDTPNLPPEVKRLRTLARVARDQGQLNRSQLYDILEVDERNNALSKVNAASGFIFHHGERLNRQVSLIATYNLDLNRMMTKPTKEEAGLTQEQKEEKAANHAVYTAELTNGGISAAAAPRIAQSSLGKVLFMFKRYGVSMYYLLFKTAREALKGETPEIRKAAMSQIAGIYGTAALFAGVQGLPMFGILAMVYNAFADDDEDDFETATRKYLGELPYKGLLNYVTNVEIASRTGLSDLIIRDSGKQDSQTIALTMMEMLGGPVFGVASRVERGLDMIRDGNIQRGIENILPSALGNILKGIRYSTEGTTTLRGDPITGEVNPWNVAVQAFGFAPADYTRQLEINNRQKGIDKSVNQEETKLKRQYYLATRMGDSEGRKEARDKLLELGAKHPALEINSGTIGDVLDRSIEAQKRVTERMRNGVAYSPKMLKEIEQNLKEYD